jgi:hypothetical protein
MTVRVSAQGGDARFARVISLREGAKVSHACPWSTAERIVAQTIVIRVT